MGIDGETWRCIDQLVVEVHDGDDGRVQKIMELCRSRGFSKIVKTQDGQLASVPHIAHAQRTMKPCKGSWKRTVGGNLRGLNPWLP